MNNFNNDCETLDTQLLTGNKDDCIFNLSVNTDEDVNIMTSEVADRTFFVGIYSTIR